MCTFSRQEPFYVYLDQDYSPLMVEPFHLPGASSATLWLWTPTTKTPQKLSDFDGGQQWGSLTKTKTTTAKEPNMRHFEWKNETSKSIYTIHSLINANQWVKSKGPKRKKKNKSTPALKTLFPISLSYPLSEFGCVWDASSPWKCSIIFPSFFSFLSFLWV